MKIIIAGTGEVGFHLSKLLAQESHDIVIIDHDKRALEKATKTLDVSTVKGDATSIKTLENAGISKADLLIAVTSTQHVNILSCIIGKNLGVKKCIARISKSEFLHRKETFDLKSIGMDEVIYPESLGANEIKNLLKESAVTDSFDFENGKLQLIGIKIDEKSALKDIFKGLNVGVRGSNLWLKTEDAYHGFDPEINSMGFGDYDPQNAMQAGTIPPPKTWSLFVSFAI